MSDFEDIERELKSLSPKQPSNDFCRRVERALGEAGTVAMCHMPANKESSNKSLVTYIPFLIELRSCNSQLSYLFFN